MFVLIRSWANMAVNSNDQYAQFPLIRDSVYLRLVCPQKNPKIILVLSLSCPGIL